MNKKIKKRKLEDYVNEKNQNTILNIVYYYGYSLTLQHFETLYDIYKKTNKYRDPVKFDYNSYFSDLNELGLINIIIDREISPCPWVSPTLIESYITEKGSSLIRNCEERLNSCIISREWIPLFKKWDISIIIAVISFIISIIALFK